MNHRPFREEVLLAGLCERKILFRLEIYDRLRQATAKYLGRDLHTRAPQQRPQGCWRSWQRCTSCWLELARQLGCSNRTWPAGQMNSLNTKEWSLLLDKLMKRSIGFLNHGLVHWMVTPNYKNKYLYKLITPMSSCYTICNIAYNWTKIHQGREIASGTISAASKQI